MFHGKFILFNDLLAFIFALHERLLASHFYKFIVKTKGNEAETPVLSHNYFRSILQ